MIQTCRGHEIGFQITIQFNLFSMFSLSCQNSINTRFTSETMMPVNKKPTFTVVQLSFKMLDAFLISQQNFLCLKLKLYDSNQVFVCKLPNLIPRVYFDWNWCAFLVMAMKKWKILSVVVLDDLDFIVDHTIYRNEYKILQKRLVCICYSAIYSI